MNYLAHLYLSSDSPGLILGSLLGDFVKGSIQTLFTSEIRKGIILHRKVDCYTDQHEIVHHSKGLITPQRRRFAGIMVDLFYDHFLARNWLRYSSVPLPDFAQHVYQILLENQNSFPEKLRNMLPYMVEQNWLASYTEICSIERAINGVSCRLKRQNSLLNSAEELEWNYAQLEKDFQMFFPDLINFSECCKKSGELNSIPISLL